MKYSHYFSVICCLLTFHLNAQFYNNGATVKLSQDVVFYSTGNVTNTVGGTMIVDGALETASNVVNNGAATLLGNGQYILAGDWINAADFNAGSSLVRFVGVSNSTVLPGGESFYRMEIDKSDGANVLLAEDATILLSLEFLQGKNKVALGENDLLMAGISAIFGYDDQHFIVTNSTGSLRKAASDASPYTFPVGYNANTYNPLTITQNGDEDVLGVRCLGHVFQNSLGDTAFTEVVVDASWKITEGIPGGSNLSLTAQWAGNDELPGFDRTACGITRFNGTSWDQSNSLTGAATGANPYSISRSGITKTGVFAVVGASLLSSVAFEPSAGWQVGELFPNPVSSTGARVQLPLNSPLKTALQVCIIDNLGREISRFETGILVGQNLLTMEIPALSAGVYHLKFMTGGQFFVKKLVVQ